jgi:diacylglycerol kinase family enzyme
LGASAAGVGARTEGVIVILNCRSGPGAHAPDTLKAAFRRHEVDAEFWCTSPKEGIRELAEKAARSDAQTIVGAGGDGTISAVAGALVKTTKRLGVLPLGTLNHFAKDIGLPVDLDAAIDVLKGAREYLVDVAEVNGRIFINNSSIGLYPRIVRHRADQQERLRRGKWPAFAWAVLSVLRVCPSYHLTITADGVKSKTRSPFFFVGNNEYQMSGLRIGKRDHLDHGALCAYFAHHSGAWGIVGLAFRSLFGRLSQAKNFEVLTGQEIKVATRHTRMDVSLDGEVCHLEMPLLYRIRPRALRVLGPARVE